MKRRFIFIYSIFLLAEVFPLYAKPSGDEARAFDQGIADERANFENQIRTIQPGERTQENQRFNQQRLQERIALEQSLQGLTFEEKQAAISAYQEKLRGEINEHNQKLKLLPPEKNNLQTLRKEFDKKTVQKIRDFYSQ